MTRTLNELKYEKNNGEEMNEMPATEGLGILKQRCETEGRQPYARSRLGWTFVERKDLRIAA